MFRVVFNMVRNKVVVCFYGLLTAWLQGPEDGQKQMIFWISRQSSLQRYTWNSSTSTLWLGIKSVRTTRQDQKTPFISLMKGVFCYEGFIYLQKLRNNISWQKIKHNSFKKNCSSCFNIFYTNFKNIPRRMGRSEEPIHESPRPGLILCLWLKVILQLILPEPEPKDKLKGLLLFSWVSEVKGQRGWAGPSFQNRLHLP